MTDAAAPRLDLADANQLAAAMVAYVAQQHGLRALIVKGFVTSHYGLRPERVSADVDVLLPPADFEPFLDALRHVGWVLRPVTADADAVAAHSRELIHPAWPGDIDVHRHFPGMLADPLTAFDALWERSVEATRAGRTVRIPDRNGAIIITALHALRHVTTSTRYDQELAGLDAVLATLQPQEQAALVESIGAVGAEGPLQELCARHGMALTVTPSPALTAWNTRRLAGDSYAGNVVAGLAQAPLRRRLGLAWRIVWPSADQFRASHPDIGPGRGALWRARVDRWRRGLRDLPRALRARRASRTGTPPGGAS